MTGGDQFGVRLLHAMLRKCPSLCYTIMDDEINAARIMFVHSSTNSMSTTCRRDSFDAILKSTKCYEIGERICTFIDDLIAMMANGDVEKEIVGRIRRAGYVHYERGICLNSAVWREFKSMVITIVGECEYANETERVQTIAAWSTFVSVIIREMKMGIWCRSDGETFVETSNAPIGNGQ